MKFLIVLILAIVALSSSTVRSASNLECEFCEFAVQYIDGYVQKNATETEIVTELDKVCKFVPASLQATCDSLISTYSSEIIQMVVNKESPATVCGAVKLCPNPSVKKVVKPVRPAKLGTVECTICGLIVGELENLISSSTTESEMVSILDNDCSKFGGLSATCQSLVNTYLPELIQLLDNNESASTVCAQVKLCPTPSAFGKKINNQKSIKFF